MAYAQATIGTLHYEVTIKAGRHELTGDEPVSNGGKDAGPAPYDLLLASLASYTAITLRMYADRKQWDLKAVHIDLHYTRDAEGARIARTLRRYCRENARYAHASERGANPHGIGSAACERTTPCRR